MPLDKRKLFLTIAVTLAIFVINLATPAGFATWLLYIIPIFIISPSLSPSFIPVLALIGTVLIVASYFLSPAGGDPLRGSVNRCLDVLVLWSIAFIIFKRKKAEQAVRQFYRELEERIDERTAELQRLNKALQSEIEERRQAEDEIKLLNNILEWRIYERTSEIEAANANLLQKNAELSKMGDDLRQSRQQLVDIIDFFPEAVFVVDNDKKVIIWNRAMEELSGVKKETMIGQGDRAYSIPFYGERRKQLFDLLDETDGSLVAKYEGYVRKGSVLYAETFCPALYYGKGAYVWCTAAPLYNTEGERVGAIELVCDTTERRNDEDALRRSEARFRGYFNTPIIGIAITSPDKHWLEMNDTLCEMLGYAHDELKTKTWAELTYSDDLAADLEKFKDLLDGKIESYSMEKRFIRKDGTVIWTSLGVGCVRKRDGSPDYITAVLQDITARKNAEAERDMLAAVVESSSDAIVVTDKPQGVIRYVNKCFEHITGYTKGEVIGKDLYLLDSGKHDEKFYHDLIKTVLLKRVWTGQMINKKKDGSLYYESCTCFPVLGKSGEILNFVAIKQDITEKLRLQSIAESVTLMDNIGYIFSGIRHEIGNPINSLLIILKLLGSKLDAAPKEVIRNYVSKAIENAARIDALLTSLKNFNMYESLQCREVAVNTFLNQFLSLISEDFKANQIEIHVQAGDNERVYGDPRALLQIMLNISTNAAAALEGRQIRKIEIQTSTIDGMVKFSITDTGCGMTVEQQDNIKPFYTSKVHGTGLGMVIVKKLITRMNGFVEVKSKHGEGTTVEFFIPSNPS